MNPLQNLIQLAAANQWCMKPDCTTCGAKEFRNALQEISGVDQADLSDSLIDLDLVVLEKIPMWEDPLRIALSELQKPERMDQVLNNWLSNIDLHIRLADLVLFYYVRRGALFAPMSVDVLSKWRAKCIDIASQTGDESLIESLVYTLGTSYKQHPSLEAVILDLTSTSQRVSHALNRIENSS